jgi:two-component system cell cycle sensor histidine kinase/response regulator CckA
MPCIWRRWKVFDVSICKLLYQKGTQTEGMSGKSNSKPKPVQVEKALEKKTANVILLVEDEDIVRSLARRLLEAKGFVVLEAASIEAARKVWGGRAEEIDLILADVQVPDGNTTGMVRELQREKPELRIIFTSGYSEDVVFDSKEELNEAAFVQKPFHPRELMSLIDAALKKEK